MGQNQGFSQNGMALEFSIPLFLKPAAMWTWAFAGEAEDVSKCRQPCAGSNHWAGLVAGD